MPSERPDRPTVPFLDVGAAQRELRDEVTAALARVVDSGWYILGAEVDAFESEWAAYCGSTHCVGVASGLDALRLGLSALGVGPGDEVIVPSNTYIATWLAVSEVGAVPVPVEPDPRTCNIDATRIEAAITPRTRVILPVHLYGQPADMDAVMRVARDNGLRVLDDAAQAHGARWSGRRVGALADVTAWSFYPGKNLGALGDGGAVTTGDAAVADRIRSLRNYGSRRKYVNDERGLNSRLDEVQAAVLRVKLRHLDRWNARRRDIADHYLQSLASTDLTLPWVELGAEPVWHLFVVRTAERDGLAATLRARGVETLVHYPIPPHLQEAYADLRHGNGAFPISEAIHRECLSLPMGPHMSDAHVAQVIDAVCRATTSVGTGLASVRRP